MGTCRWEGDPIADGASFRICLNRSLLTIAVALPDSASAVPSGKGLVTAVASAPAAAAEPTGLRSGATFVASEDAVPGIALPGADKTAVYLDSAGRVIPMAKSPSGVSEPALIGCTPVSGRDNPHWSSGDVSGHGWWKKGTCSRTVPTCTTASTSGTRTTAGDRRRVRRPRNSGLILGVATVRWHARPVTTRLRRRGAITWTST